MKIQKANSANVNFKAKVDHKLILSARKYYSDRFLHIQYDTFNKAIEKFGMYGDKNSFIFEQKMPVEGKDKYVLFLKNEEIRKGKALIIAVEDYFCSILKIITNINDNKMIYWEDLLSKV